ncbi:MAG: PKD domain-containing protein, partial [Bacteroidales bacterium]|nr:PKD domain-containing protein [Bacteroidales bacterium]
NTDSLVIDVRPVPIILFGYELPACVGEFVQFTNQCLYAESYHWDFGDGNTSTLAEPQHIYSTAGNYLVRLTAISAFSCDSSDTTTVNIAIPPPEPLFEINPKSGCSPLTVYFNFNASQYGANSLYHWDFGNGTGSDNLIPPDSIVYYGGFYSDTIYYISFQCYNSCGSKTLTDSVIVFPTPLSGFEMIHDWDCTPVDVTFKNTSKGLPDDFYWDLGDGNTTTEFEPVHTYTTGTSSTTYSIHLISYNECGTDTITQDLLVKPNTVDAFYSVDKFMGCEGDTFYFHNYSTDTSNAGEWNVAWDFGDGQGSSADHPNHTYSDQGIYTVILHVDNGCGHDDVYDTIRINQTPDLEIILNNEACVGETLYFDYSTNDAIAGRKWYFGDGDSSVLSNPYHTYQAEGIYNVILQGVSALGFPACTGIASKQVIIRPTPDATISPDTSGCAPLQIVFQGDSGSYHLWNFGDGSANTSNPVHVFETPGLFKVKLVSENTNMCRDMDSLEIRVFPTPESGFSYTTSGGYPEQLTFSNISTGATECYWDFGNGITSTNCEIIDPVDYYNTQLYTITLITSNQYGCADTAVMEYGTGFKGLFVPNAFAPAHPDPGVNLFLPKGIGLLEYHIQVFDTWGNLIWESSEIVDGNPSEGWDGKDKNGNEYPQDVYVWKAYAKFTDGTNWSGVEGKPYGTVTLIR